MAGYDGLGALSASSADASDAASLPDAAGEAPAVVLAETGASSPAAADAPDLDDFGSLPGMLPGTASTLRPRRRRAAPAPAASAPAFATSASAISSTAVASGANAVAPTTVSAVSGTKTGSAGQVRKGALLEVLQALGHEVLPTARTRSEIDRLAVLGEVEPLLASNFDFRALLSGVLGWDGDRVTKPMVKAAGAALSARVGSAARFAQGVEMLAFVAACAPLLEPDRLTRIMLRAPETPCAYAPVTATLHLTAALETLLAPYDEARRERLLASLWATAHRGRWWDATGMNPQTRRRRNAPGNYVPVDIADRRGRRGARTTLDELLTGELAYSEAATRLLAMAEPTAADLDRLAAMAADDRADPDLVVLVAHVPGLAPICRPSSPISWLVDRLVDAVVLDGAVVDGALPRAPIEWAELYPEAPVAPFPIDERVWEAFHGVGVPGFGGEVSVLRNAAELAANRTYMGNCTWSYLTQCQSGAIVIGRVDRGRESYNFSLSRDRHAWGVREVNSRFNGGNVPRELLAGLAQLARQSSQAKRKKADKG